MTSKTRNSSGKVRAAGMPEQCWPIRFSARIDVVSKLESSIAVAAASDAVLTGHRSTPHESPPEVVTTTFWVAVTARNVAVISAEPTPRAITSPAVVTSATPRSVDDHVAVPVAVCVEPSEKETTAENCRVAPTSSTPSAPTIATDVTVTSELGCGAPDSFDPHADTKT